jgi:hypothetical protein|tara:strand:+ start:1139 stop:1564 length:426 start_codon:yes stop_codon:yes gene_type:complete
MGEEFYSVIKLISGEEIFALVSIDNDQEDPIVVLQNPLVMKMMNSSKGSYIKVNRWIELSSEDIFIMRLDRILTMSESKDAKLIAIYDNFIEDEQDETMIDVYQPNGEVQITNTMGYISSVEDARKKFEEIFKINQKPKEN